MMLCCIKCFNQAKLNSDGIAQKALLLGPSRQLNSNLAGTVLSWVKASL